MKIVVGFMERNGDTIALEGLKVSVVGSDKWGPFLIDNIVIDNPAGFNKIVRASHDTG